MDRLHNPALADPEVRRVFEEEVLQGETTDTLLGLLTSLGLTRRELAGRLGVTPGRVSQILSGDENLTIRSLAALGWALGIRFDLHPTPMGDRVGTPAEHDPPPPAWLSALAPSPTIRFGVVPETTAALPVAEAGKVIRISDAA